MLAKRDCPPRWFTIFLKRRNGESKDIRSAGRRPDGVTGLLIDEIQLKGILRTPKGFVEQVSLLDGRKSYLLRQGDQLFDGDVISINRSQIIFKQVVEYPTALKPFREVLKSLAGA